MPDIEPIYFKTTPILPTEYNDALSYMETLYRINDKLTETIKVVNAFGETVLNAAKQYTDSAIAEKYGEFQKQYNELVTQVEQFQTAVDNTLKGFQDQFDDYKEKTTAEVISAKAYTDASIAQNNEWLLEQISQQVISVRVLNPFTGERVSIQDMIDYLSMFHMQDGIKISTLGNRQNTVNQMIAYNAKCSDLVVNGANIIVDHS